MEKVRIFAPASKEVSVYYGTLPRGENFSPLFFRSSQLYGASIAGRIVSPLLVSRIAHL